MFGTLLMTVLQKVQRRHNRKLHLGPKHSSIHSHSRLRNFIGTLEQSEMLSMGSLANT